MFRRRRGTKNKGHKLISDRSGFAIYAKDAIVEPGTHYVVEKRESDGMFNLVDHPLNHVNRYAKFGDPKPVKDARPDRDWTTVVEYTVLPILMQGFAELSSGSAIQFSSQAVLEGNGVLTSVNNIAYDAQSLLNATATETSTNAVAFSAVSLLEADATFTAVNSAIFASASTMSATATLTSSTFNPVLDDFTAVTADLPSGGLTWVDDGSSPAVTSFDTGIADGGFYVDFDGLEKYSISTTVDLSAASGDWLQLDYKSSRPDFAGPLSLQAIADSGSFNEKIDITGNDSSEGTLELDISGIVDRSSVEIVIIGDLSLTGPISLFDRFTFRQLRVYNKPAGLLESFNNLTYEGVGFSDPPPVPYGGSVSGTPTNEWTLFQGTLADNVVSLSTTNKTEGLYGLQVATSAATGDEYNIFKVFDLTGYNTVKVDARIVSISSGSITVGLLVSDGVDFDVATINTAGGFTTLTTDISGFANKNTVSVYLTAETPSSALATFAFDNLRAE